MRNDIFWFKAQYLIIIPDVDIHTMKEKISFFIFLLISTLTEVKFILTAALFLAETTHPATRPIPKDLRLDPYDQNLVAYRGSIR